MQLADLQATATPKDVFVVLFKNNMVQIVSAYVAEVH